MGLFDFPISNEPGSIFTNFIPKEFVNCFFVGISAEEAVVVRIKRVNSDTVVFM